MTKKSRECILFACAIALSTCTESLNAQNLNEFPDNSLNVIIATDLGRNGYYDQKLIVHHVDETVEHN